MKKITLPFPIPKMMQIAFVFIFMFCVSPSFSQVNLHDCGFQCTSNNFSLNDVFLSATNTPGSVPFSNTTCTPGTTSSAYIMLNYTSNSSSALYYVRLNADLIINGIHNFVNVDLGSVTPGAGQVQIYGPFNYVCGQDLTLANTVIAWKTNSNNNPGSNYTCGDYNAAQCNFSSSTIIKKPFAVQFVYNASLLGSNMSVNFTSITLGGVGPYSYAWDFNGDGITDSTNPNPNFIYSGNSNTATLTTTDSQMLTSYQSKIILLPE